MMCLMCGMRIIPGSPEQEEAAHWQGLHGVRTMTSCSGTTRGCGRVDDRTAAYLEGARLPHVLRLGQPERCSHER